MADEPWNERVLEQIIHDALAARDFVAVRDGLAVLATVNAERAQIILDTINLGLDIAKARAERTV